VRFDFFFPANLRVGFQQRISSVQILCSNKTTNIYIYICCTSIQATNDNFLVPSTNVAAARIYDVESTVAPLPKCANCGSCRKLISRVDSGSRSRINGATKCGAS